MAFASWPRGCTSNAQNHIIITAEVVSLRHGHVARGENLIPGTKYEYVVRMKSIFASYVCVQWYRSFRRKVAYVPTRDRGPGGISSEDFPSKVRSCACPQCSSYFVVTLGSAKPPAFDLPVHLSRAH